MLRTRLIVGTVLAVGVVGLLVADGAFGKPFFFGLAAVSFVLGWLATREFLSLLAVEARPPRLVTLLSVAAMLLANWYGLAVYVFWYSRPQVGEWEPVCAAFVGAVGVAVIVAVLTYPGPGSAVPRLANAVFALVYLGLLPSFLIRLRWNPFIDSDVPLLLAIFVPKCGDIGAYFTGRLFGRHPMAPRLSPKKTWEGFAGGTAFAVLTAVGLGWCAPVFRHGDAEAVLFGLFVGWAGVLGDLAESMIKRDAQAKDASANVPGFGGVLDVIDSVIFAAPVAYLFLAR